MKQGGKWLLVVLVGVVAAWAGIEFGRWSQTPERAPPSPENSGAITQLLTAPLTTTDKQIKKLADWQGKVLVVNFWATWCPPCREEMPEFSLAQDRYGPNGVQFVGIAIDEGTNVVEFSKKTPVTYPLLIASAELPALMGKLGNLQGGLPFTIIIGRDGKPFFSHLGLLNREELAKQLALVVK